MNAGSATCRGMSAVLATLCVLGWAGLTAAAPRQPPPRLRAGASPVQAARALFSRAEVHYSLGRFHEALALYAKAYELLPLPGFLFNIGQCHRNLKRFERALFFYRGYLRKAPLAPNRAVVLELITSAERQLKAQLAVAARRRAQLLRPRLPPERRRRVDPFQGHGGDVVRPIPVTRRWWFWASIAAGLATVVGISVGVALSVKPESVLPRGSLGTVDVRF